MCAATMSYDLSYDLKLGGIRYGATPEVVPRARPDRGGRCGILGRCARRTA